MAIATELTRHPYYEEISRLFYNYRLAQLNRRYYAVLLEREKRRNFWVQLFVSLSTVLAFALFSLGPSFTDLTVTFGRVAALLSALAFVLSVAAPVFGWSQKIDEITTRIHAWHYAERQLESALRFVNHSAESKREADLQVRFADEAFRTADNLPDTGKQDMELTKTLRQEVETAFPQDYVWKAL